MKSTLFTLLTSLLGVMIAQGDPTEADAERILFPSAETPVFAWQKNPMTKAKGGEKFAVSAFIHPLTTPRGFVCTEIQPEDHLHHLGIWWPWKYVEVDGKKFNTWEIQQGQGAHVARSVKEISRTPKSAVWEVKNETLIKQGDAAPKVVIHETGRIALTIQGDNTLLDISLDQKAADSPVVIGKYRYSGFTWRGPETWNKDNSTMLSSEGKGRDDANGTPARWLMLNHNSTNGVVSVLIMSQAQIITGAPEKIRVWSSKDHNGSPFVNFNPVFDKPLPLDDANPAVSKRSYRVIAADRLIGADEAEAEWKKWTGR
jgi:Methane oxygenase PmoA